MMKSFLLASSVWKLSLIWKARLDGVGWFEKLSLFNLDSRCAALIGGQARYLYFWRTGKLLFIRWLAKDTRCIIIFKKVSQAPSFSKEVWVEKEVDAHVSTRSKLMQKRKINTHVDVHDDSGTYTHWCTLYRVIHICTRAPLTCFDMIAALAKNSVNCKILHLLTTLLAK